MKRVFLILTIASIFIYGSENKFRSFKSYNMGDFNLSWDISYFDVVFFSTFEQKGKKELKLIGQDYPFIRIFKVGNHKFTPQDKKDLVYLANVLIKMNDKYFWKKVTALVWSHDFTSLRFIDKSKKSKVIDSIKDIKDMLGSIDTNAEFHLWLYATDKDYPYIHSFSIKNDTYMVKYLDDNDGTCQYREFIKYYNRDGKLIKTEYIKRYRKKNCVEAFS